MFRGNVEKNGSICTRMNPEAGPPFRIVGNNRIVGKNLS